MKMQIGVVSVFTQSIKDQKMTISERIFEKLKELSMTQKEFSERTSIQQSTISEWKKKHTNPSADKIMVICKVLGVSPEWLLSGTEGKGQYRNPVDWFVIGRDTELGELILEFNRMDSRKKDRLLGYMKALTEEKK